MFCSKHTIYLFLSIFVISGNGIAQVQQSGFSASEVNTPRYIRMLADTGRLERMLRHYMSLENINTDSAIVGFKNIFEQSIKAGYNDAAALSLIRLGVCYKKTGDNTLALKVTQQALPYCQHAFTKERLLYFYYARIAGCYRVLNEKDSAITYHLKALEKAKALNDTDALCEIYNNTSLLYLQSGYYDKALDYLKKAEQTSGTYNFKDIGMVYLHMAEAYKGKNDTANFFAYTRKAFENLRNKRLISESKYSPWQSVLFSLCGYFSLMKKPDSVIYYANLSLQTEDKNNPYIHLNSYQYLAEGYYMRGDLQKAKLYGLTALSITQKTDEHTDNEIYRILSNIYDRLGDYKQAMEYLKTYIRLNAIINDEEKSRDFHEIEAKYRTAQKDKEIAQNQVLILNQKVQLKSKNILIGGVASASLFLIIASVSLYRIGRHKQRLQNERINNMQQEQEIGKLKAAVAGEEKERARIARELHDGVVSQLVAVKLNLDHLKRKKEPIEPHELDEAYQQLQETTIELRKSAHNLLPDVLMRSGLEAALSLFCDKIKKSADLDVHFEAIGTFPRLQPDIELTIYRIIQELMQNVLKHAQASHLLVQLIYQNDLLSITVEDNGKGFTEDPYKPEQGLNDIRERIKMLNGNIEVNSKNNSGTTVYIEFDIFMLTKDKIYGY